MEPHDFTSQVIQGADHPSSPKTHSLSESAQLCSRLFKESRVYLETQGLQSQSYSVQLLEECKRYDLWARNIAAAQPSQLPTSLEYRLRSDGNARKIVLKALGYVIESLEMVNPLLTGNKDIVTWDVASEQFGQHFRLQDGARDLSIQDARTEKEDSEFFKLPISEHVLEVGTASELTELCLSIQEGVTALFELSMVIRKKPEKDEYIKASSRYSFDPRLDVNHVGDKYPAAKKHDAWFVERLGTAITRRRQYLLYRREHQKRLEEVHNLSKDGDGKTVWSGTKASTFLPDNRLGGTTPTEPIPNDPIIASSRPRTEYADSSRGKDGSADLLRTPLLPKGVDGVRASYGKHFECRYCWRPQTIQNKNEWKKHIFSDLRPYVCTFEGCGLNMFESQNQWFDHEMRFHRKQWNCNICERYTPMSRSDLETHMHHMHTDQINYPLLDAELDKSMIPRIDATSCPLCTEYGTRLQCINQSTKCDVSLKQFQEHLGRHMEQLALAALPEDDRDEEDDDDLVDLSSSSSDELFDYNSTISHEAQTRRTNPTLRQSTLELPMPGVRDFSARQPQTIDSSGFDNVSREHADMTKFHTSEFVAASIGANRPKMLATRDSDESNKYSLDLTPKTTSRISNRVRRLFGGISKRDSSELKPVAATNFPEIPGEASRHATIPRDRRPLSISSDISLRTNEYMNNLSSNKFNAPNNPGSGSTAAGDSSNETLPESPPLGALVIENKNFNYEDDNIEGPAAQSQKRERERLQQHQEEQQQRIAQQKERDQRERHPRASSEESTGSSDLPLREPPVLSNTLRRNRKYAEKPRPGQLRRPRIYQEDPSPELLRRNREYAEGPRPANLMTYADFEEDNRSNDLNTYPLHIDPQPQSVSTKRRASSPPVSEQHSGDTSARNARLAEPEKEEDGIPPTVAALVQPGDEADSSSRDTPPPSAGAQRYQKFDAGKGTSSWAHNEGPEARAKTYEAWENMRGHGHSTTNSDSTPHEGLQSEATFIDSKYKAIWDAQMGTASQRSSSYRKAPEIEEEAPADDGWGFSVTTLKKNKKKKGKNIVQDPSEVEEVPPPPLAEPASDYSRDHEIERLRERAKTSKDSQERIEAEIELYPREIEKEANELRVREELEMKRLREEKAKAEESARLKKERELVIKEFKVKESKLLAEEIKAKEEAEKEIARRLEAESRESGVSEKQIAGTLKQGIPIERPTYTRMARRHLSIETLRVHGIDYEFDQDPGYILIKRWVSEEEQDKLWNHTRRIRRDRITAAEDIEGNIHNVQVDNTWVKGMKNERRPSPSPLLKFLARGNASEQSAKENDNEEEVRGRRL